MKRLLPLILLVSGLAFAAGKDFIPPALIVSGGAMTGTAVVTSSVVDIRGFDNIALQANFTGTPTGSFAVQVSEDYNANTGTAGNWKTLSTSLTGPAGATSSSYAEVNQSAAAYMRVQYTNASGSGVLNIFLGAKAL